MAETSDDTPEQWPGALDEAQASLIASGAVQDPRVLARDAYGARPARRDKDAGNALDMVLNLIGPHKGKERFVTWPEHMIHSGVTAPRDVATGTLPLRGPDGFNPEAVTRAMDLAGLAAGGSVPAIYGSSRNALANVMPQPKLEPVTFNPFDVMTPREKLLSQSRQIMQGLHEDAAPGTGAAALSVSQRLQQATTAAEQFVKQQGLPESVAPPWNKMPKADQDAFIADSYNQMFGPGSYFKEIESVKPEPAPVWYSAVEHAVENAKMNKGTPEQWMNYIRNQPGVKMEELNWLGLGDDPVVAGPGWQGTVSKADVQKWLGENKVELKEVRRGKINEDTPEYMNAVNDIIEERLNDFETTNGYPANERVRGEIERHAAEVVRDDPEMFGIQGSAHARYEDYQLPGGENYREVLFTMPTKKSVKADNLEIRDATAEGRGFEVIDRSQNAVVDHFPTRAEAEAEVTNIDANQADRYHRPSTQYNSSHWDEPNVLAHTRVNDRAFYEPDFVVVNMQSGNKSKAFKTMEEAQAFRETLPENVRGNTQAMENPDPAPVRALHIEEIQSDWHQAGRKQGYKGKPNEELVRASQEADARLEELRQKYVKEGAKHLDAYNQAIGVAKEAREAVQRASDKAIPDAPFKTTWADVVLKRMLREAADNGYDAISWTPGAQQAQRYSLEKQVKYIDANPWGKYFDANQNPIQGRNVTINTNSGVHASAVIDETGKIIVGYDRMRDGVGRNLADYIGQEMADKVIKAKADTKIDTSKWKAKRNGGEEGGDWSVYDGDGNLMNLNRIESSDGMGAINQVVAQHTPVNGTARIEGADLRMGGEGMKAFYDKMLVDKMNALGKKYGAKVEWRETGPPANEYFIQRMGSDAQIQGQQAYSVRAKDPSGADVGVMSSWLTEAGANEIVKKLTKEAQDKSPRVPFFRIPDAMRAAMQSRGMPLFQAGIPFPLVPVEHDPFKVKK